MLKVSGLLCLLVMSLYLLHIPSVRSPFVAPICWCCGAGTTPITRHTLFAVQADLPLLSGLQVTGQILSQGSEPRC